MTSPVPPAASYSPRVMIDELYAYIDTAHEILEQGDYIALTDLNDWVQELCQCVMQLPVEEAKMYVEELQQLMESLDDLKAVMEQHKSVLNEQMGGLEQSKKAAKAYQKSHHMGSDEKPE
jgi:hypothetical protein